MVFFFFFFPSALYGIMFPMNLDGAYSNCRLWKAIGYVLGYACSSWLCVNVKLSILIAMLVIGMSGYMDIEITYRKTKRSSVPSQNF